MSTAGSRTEYTEDCLAEGKFIITDYIEKQLFSVFIKGFPTAARQAANLKCWWQKVQKCKAGKGMDVLFAN